MAPATATVTAMHSLASSCLLKFATETPCKLVVAGAIEPETKSTNAVTQVVATEGCRLLSIAVTLG